MNTKAVSGEENQDDDIIVVEDEGQDTEQTTDEHKSIGDQGEDQDTESNEGDSDEVIVSIGEEAPPPEEQTHAPVWVRELR